MPLEAVRPIRPAGPKHAVDGVTVEAAAAGALRVVVAAAASFASIAFGDAVIDIAVGWMGLASDSRKITRAGLF